MNVSADQLSQPAFAAMVEEALDRARMEPRSLVLEVTESVFISDTTRAAEVLTRLRRRGVRIALDDFGTEFSTLRYLQELPVDIVKIDRSFVQGDGSSGSTDMLEAITTMVRSLNLEMIAEGVESEADLNRLKLLGGEAAQGFYFTRPMPAAQARAFRPQPVLISTDAR